MDHEHHTHGEKTSGTTEHSCCAPKGKRDWLLISMTGVLVASYALHFFMPQTMEGMPLLAVFVMAIVETLQKIWWGIALGIIASGFLSDIPREIIIGIFGKPGKASSIVRATLGGMLLDLCSHGILIIAMQLYKRGISLGQLMAFLIASPWNSLSLTLILWGLVGLKWTLTVLLLSLVIAIISGIIFDVLERNGTLPPNPYAIELPEHFSLRKDLGAYIRSRRLSFHYVSHILKTGIQESMMVLRWIFFGVVLSALIRTFFAPELFASVFAPTLLGLGATLLFATILEVCSEGSTPVAADFLLRAHAPGNMFAFLMTGVSTDYTEILALKETTKSWKIAFFLPLITVPQVVALALILNNGGI